jgi:hypothetical protein
MKKRPRFLVVIATLLLVLLSGCYPVYVPVDGGGHHGMGEGHEHGEHHGDNDRF